MSNSNACLLLMRSRSHVNAWDKAFQKLVKPLLPDLVPGIELRQSWNERRIKERGFLNEIGNNAKWYKNFGNTPELRLHFYSDLDSSATNKIISEIKYDYIRLAMRPDVASSNGLIRALSQTARLLESIDYSDENVHIDSIVFYGGLHRHEGYVEDDSSVWRSQTDLAIGMGCESLPKDYIKARRSILASSVLDKLFSIFEACVGESRVEYVMNY